MKSFALISTAILLLGAPVLAAPQPDRDEVILNPFNPAEYLAYRAGLAANHHAAKPKPKVTHPKNKTVVDVTPPVTTASVTVTPPAPAVTPAPAVPAVSAPSDRVVAPTVGPFLTVTAGTPHAPAVPPVVVPPPATPDASDNDPPVTISLPAISMGTPAFLPGAPVAPAGRPIVIVPFRPPVISAFRP